MRNPWLVLIVVATALFLIVVDATVLFTALPVLTRELAASASARLWIVNIYPLVVAGLLPGLGTLGDRLGHRRLFIAGLLVFGGASLASAFAPSPALLIAARALLGVGGAMMMPATLAIIRQSFEDPGQRAVAIGIWASIASGGAAIGPVLGGALLEHFWWGSVFLINVSVVALVLPLALILVPRPASLSPRPWDLVASLQVMLGLFGLVYAIKELAKRDIALPALLVSAGGGLFFLTLFVRRQNRAAHPLIDFGLFRNRPFSAAVGAALLASMVLMGFELVLGQHLQLVLGLSPLEAGLAIAPTPIGAFLAGPLAGLLLHRAGARPVTSACLLLAGLGLGGLLLAPPGAGATVSWPQLAWLALFGIGIGGAMTAASSSIMTESPPGRAGMAASIEEVAFELGSTFGIAMFGSLMTAVYTTWLVLPKEIAISVPAAVRLSLDEALGAAAELPAPAAERLAGAGREAFEAAFDATTAGAALLLLAGAAVYRLVTRERRPGPVFRAEGTGSAARRS
ncbi:MFS transporter [Geminicoccaceae bacterium 1502E]|nr:MFS transporter [Geminicoccaceae bacterium 1502E]